MSLPCQKYASALDMENANLVMSVVNRICQELHVHKDVDVLWKRRLKFMEHNLFHYITSTRMHIHCRLWYCAPLQWRHNGHSGVSDHQPHDCLLNRLFRRRSKKTSKLRVTGLCAGNSPITGEFPAQMASNAENASISWRHHAEWNNK